MRRKERQYTRLISIAIVTLCAIVGLGLNNCSLMQWYAPTTHEGGDVLDPSDEVKLNPIGWVKDGKVVNDAGEEIHIENGVIVNEAFSIWVGELRAEIKRLRGGN